MDIAPPSTELIQHTIDKFWETIPAFWHEVRAHIRETASQQYNLTVEQFHILRHIRKGKGSVGILAEAMHISRPAISLAVDTLVNKGLVTRTQNPVDRRYVHLELTPNGGALLEALFTANRVWMAERLCLLSPVDIEALIHAMSSLQQIMSK
jgi:DNA-binding MarR family transcriptional regulator